MSDQTDYAVLRDEAIAATKRLAEILPQLLDMAYRQGGRDVATNLAQVALAFPENTSEATRKPSHGKSPTPPPRGKVMAQVNEELRAHGSAGADATAFRQLILDRGVKRSSVYMALRRLCETRTIIERDGRLYHRDHVPTSSLVTELRSEGPARASEHSTGPSVNSSERKFAMEPP